MDLDNSALWLATRSHESFIDSREKGLGEDVLLAAGKVAWRFILVYMAEHGEIPPPSVILENSGQKVEAVEEGITISYVVDKLFDRAEFRALQYGLGKSYEAMEQGNQDDAKTQIHKLSDHLRNVAVKNIRVHTLAESVGAVAEMYERTKRGEIGVPFPWQTMTDVTMGMWPKTLTGFVARPGVGKTFTLINIADHACFECGKRVLLVSPEMTRVELAERQVALRGKIGYGDLVAATLGKFAEPHFYDTIKGLQETATNYFILDDEERLGASYIEEAVDAVKPDLLGIDSIYMLKVATGQIKGGSGSKGGRYDRILDTVDWMRSFNRRCNIPFVAISQLSREGDVKKGAKRALKKGQGTGGLEKALAMTDTLFWDFHNLFAMYQDEDMKQDKQMLYAPLKARRQAKISAVVTRWDLDEMNFEEIGTEVVSEGGGYSDNTYDEVVY
jgi:replicative DNA helicase